MDLYHIALYFHIIALLVASGATAVMKIAAGRLARARTVGDALDWHKLQTSTAKFFPMMLALFVITGSYMVSRSAVGVWSSGFVTAGMFGVVFLLASGIYLGLKGKALGAMLQGIAAKDPNAPMPRMVPPALIVALPIVNTFVALSVAFDMVTKPTSVASAMLVVAIGIVLGAVIGLRQYASIPKAARAM